MTVTVANPELRIVADGLRFPEGPVCMPDGSVALVEIESRRITRVAANGAKTTIATVAGAPNGLALGPEMTLAWRPSHWFAAIGGILCVILPTMQPWFERQPVSRALASVRGLWPLAAFLLSYSLIASRGATPFLYFQF